MGCYTYAYTKLFPQPNQDEIRKKIIKAYMDNLEEYKRWRGIRLGHNKPTKDEKEIIQFHPEYGNLNKLLYYIEYTKRCLRKIKRKKAENAIRKRYAFAEGLSYFNDKFYKSVNYHIPFRTPIYSEEVLTCYDDFLNFYLNPENHCYLTSVNTEEELDNVMLDFWKQYPYGIIRFG